MGMKIILVGTKSRKKELEISEMWCGGRMLANGPIKIQTKKFWEGLGKKGGLL